jgi:hypothetical protein
VKEREEVTLDKIDDYNKSIESTSREVTKLIFQKLIPVIVKEAAAESGAVAKTAAQAAPSLLAVPIAGVAAVEATTTEAPVVEAPVVEAPAEKSIIATPVIAEPAEPEAKPIEPAVEPAKIEVEAPKVETPKAETLAPEVVAPVIAAPAIETITESAPASEPTTGLAKDEPFIFRMDRKLNLKNLEAKPAIEVNTGGKLKKVDTPPPLPEDDPGYLERILEKIGF